MRRAGTAIDRAGAQGGRDVVVCCSEVGVGLPPESGCQVVKVGGESSGETVRVEQRRTDTGEVMGGGCHDPVGPASESLTVFGSAKAPLGREQRAVLGPVVCTAEENCGQFR